MIVGSKIMESVLVPIPSFSFFMNLDENFNFIFFSSGTSNAEIFVDNNLKTGDVIFIFSEKKLLLVSIIVDY